MAHEVSANKNRMCEHTVREISAYVRRVRDSAELYRHDSARAERFCRRRNDAVPEE